MTTDTLDRQVTFRDPGNGQIVREWAYSGGETWLSNDGARVLATKYSHDKPTLSTLYDAVAGDRGGVLVFDTVSGRKMGQLSETRVLNTSWMGGFVSNTLGGAAALAFAPDNQSLAAARDDGSIYLYSLKTFLPVAQIGHTETVDSRLLGQSPRPLQWVAFDARGDKLYGIAQYGAEVLAWDVPKL
jgi:WD40 repeat protein